MHTNDFPVIDVEPVEEFQKSTKKLFEDIHSKISIFYSEYKFLKSVHAFHVRIYMFSFSTIHLGFELKLCFQPPKITKYEHKHICNLVVMTCEHFKQGFSTCCHVMLA